MKKILAVMTCLVMLLGAASAFAFEANTEITVMSREDGSGTRGAFVELLGVEVKDESGEKVDRTTVEAVITNSTSVMLGGVAGDPYAIGYVSLGSLNDTVKALAIDGTPVSAQAIIDGDYQVSRPFMLAYKEGLSEAAQDFLNYILSSEGQAVIAENGYIAVDDAAPAYSGSAGGKVVVAGSSSVTPVMEKLKEAYIALNPDVEIEIQLSDSSTGMQAAIDGIADIGMASRQVKDSEVEKGLSATTIAMDGIAIIVHLENPVDGLSSEAVQKIYTGEIETWSEVE